MTALFNLAQSAFVFKTANRDMRRLRITTAKELPALGLVSGNETFLPRQTREMPPKQIIDADIWVFTDASSVDVSPEIELHRVLTAIEQALKPSVMAGVQTLGLQGLVSHCWPEGTVPKYSVGPIVAKGILPVKILVLK